MKKQRIEIKTKSIKIANIAIPGGTRRRRLCFGVERGPRFPGDPLQSGLRDKGLPGDAERRGFRCGMVKSRERMSSSSIRASRLASQLTCASSACGRARAGLKVRLGLRQAA